MGRRRDGQDDGPRGEVAARVAPAPITGPPGHANCEKAPPRAAQAGAVGRRRGNGEIRKKRRISQHSQRRAQTSDNRNCTDCRVCLQAASPRRRDLPPQTALLLVQPFGRLAVAAGQRLLLAGADVLDAILQGRAAGIFSRARTRITLCLSANPIPSGQADAFGGAGKSRRSRPAMPTSPPSSRIAGFCGPGTYRPACPPLAAIFRALMGRYRCKSRQVDAAP